MMSNFDKFIERAENAEFGYDRNDEYVICEHKKWTKIIHALKETKEILNWYGNSENWVGNPHELSGMCDSGLDLSDIADDGGKRARGMKEEIFITALRLIREPKGCGCGRIVDSVPKGTPLIEGWCMVQCSGCEAVRPIRYSNTIPTRTL